MKKKFKRNNLKMKRILKKNLWSLQKGKLRSKRKNKRLRKRKLRLKRSKNKRNYRKNRKK